eukprot:TRINITY_DN148_c0_g2_i1.p2 TRINITY_DN148_c0_g2~~TRINITY_DN148_c0_g2_i1.p2  ORF type:complete len:54 (+),score=2.64 TRINITY_DN148_c0_g2_i1:244-405(+)
MSLFVRADTTELYKLLRVEKSATTREITKAFRRLSLEYHPDKWGPTVTRGQPK